MRTRGPRIGGWKDLREAGWGRGCSPLLGFIKGSQGRSPEQGPQPDRPTLPENPDGHHSRARLGCSSGLPSSGVRARAVPFL